MFRTIFLLIISFFTIVLSTSSARSFVGVTPQSWESLYVAGEQALEKEQYKEAELRLQAARRASGGDPAKELIVLDTLARLYDDQDNYSLEEQALLDSLHLMHRLPDYPESVIGSTQLQLAIVNVFMNRMQLAEQHARLGLIALKESLGPAAPDVALALNNLGWIEFQLNKFTAAESCFRQSLYITRQTFGEKGVLYGMAAKNLATLYEIKRDPKRASFWYQQAGKSFKACFGTDDPLTRETSRLRQAHQPALHQ